jgi:hypothetical protein
VPEDASTLALGTLGFAVLAVAFTPLWRLTCRLLGLIQEAGYLIARLVTGTRFKTWFFVVHFRKADLFVAQPVITGWWPSKVATMLAGLPAPSLAGLLLARGVYVGWDPTFMLVGVLVLMGGLVFFHGNWSTLVTIVVVGGFAALFIYGSAPQPRLGAVVGLAWVLLLGGLRWNFEMSSRAHEGKAGGPLALQELTDVPALVWAYGFVLLTVGALFAGSHWLLQA